MPPGNSERWPKLAPLCHQHLHATIEYTLAFPQPRTLLLLMLIDLRHGARLRYNVVPLAPKSGYQSLEKLH